LRHSIIVSLLLITKQTDGPRRSFDDLSTENPKTFTTPQKAEGSWKVSVSGLSGGKINSKLTFKTSSRTWLKVLILIIVLQHRAHHAVCNFLFLLREMSCCRAMRDDRLLSSHHEISQAFCFFRGFQQAGLSRSIHLDLVISGSPIWLMTVPAIEIEKLELVCLGKWTFNWSIGQSS
jgi:hypothetical protein